VVEHRKLDEFESMITATSNRQTELNGEE